MDLSQSLDLNSHLPVPSPLMLDSNAFSSPSAVDYFPPKSTVSVSLSDNITKTEKFLLSRSWRKVMHK